MEDDIQKIAEINTGIGAIIGKFRTALVLKNLKLYVSQNYIDHWRKKMVLK